MGDGVKNRVAVFINGDPYYLGWVQHNHSELLNADPKYKVFVAAPFSSYPLPVASLKSATKKGLEDIVDEVMKVVDDDDELLIYATPHGSPGCLNLQDACVSRNDSAFQKLLSLHVAKRTVIMSQCFSGDWAKSFTSDPRTLFISAGSKGAVTSPLDLAHLFDPAPSIPDRDANRNPSWSERFAFTQAKGSGASPVFIAGKDYEDTGMGGGSAEPPHYAAQALPVSSFQDYRAKLATLKPGDHAVVAVLNADEPKSKAYRATFEQLAREARGHALFLIINNGNAPEYAQSEEFKRSGIVHYPSVVLSDYRGYKVALTLEEHLRDPLAHLSKVYDNVQSNPSYWVERVEKGASFWWPKVQDEFRQDPDVMAALRRYCANQPSCPRNSDTEMLKFVFKQSIQQHPDVFRDAPIRIQTIPTTPEFSELRRDVWRIVVKRGLGEVWHELSDELRQDPALLEVLAENGQDAKAILRSVWIESIKKHPDSYPRFLIQTIPMTPEYNELRRVAWLIAVERGLKTIDDVPLTPEYNEVRHEAWMIAVKSGVKSVDDVPLTPEYNEVRREAWLIAVFTERKSIYDVPLTPEYSEVRRVAWRIAVDRGLEEIWPKLSPELKKDHVLTEVLAEKGKDIPKPNNWDLRVGGGASFGQGAGTYLHLGMDLLWRPVHFADDHMHAGVSVGAGYDEMSQKLDSSHWLTHSNSSVRIGGAFQLSSSYFTLGVAPFVSAVHVSRTEELIENKKTTDTPISSAWRRGAGLEVSIAVRAHPSQYLEVPGVYISYGHHRLLDHGKDAAEYPRHQIMGGLMFQF